MKTPATKNELLEWVTSARAGWDEILARLQPADMEQSGVVGEWSIKDLIAHITWSENEMVGMLKERTLVGSELWDLSQDERNQVVYLQNKERPFDEVLSEARQIYTQLLQQLEGLQDAELHEPACFRGMPSDWQPWRIIAGNTYLHYQEHTMDLQSWLSGKTS